MSHARGVSWRGLGEDLVGGSVGLESSGGTRHRDRESSWRQVAPGFAGRSSLRRSQAVRRAGARGVPVVALHDPPASRVSPTIGDLENAGSSARDSAIVSGS